MSQIFELLTGKTLFRFPDGDPRTHNELDKEPEYHLGVMQKLIGKPFPPRASEAAHFRKALVDVDGNLSIFQSILT